MTIVAPSLRSAVSTVLETTSLPDPLLRQKRQRLVLVHVHPHRIALAHPKAFPLVASRPPEAPWLRPGGCCAEIEKTLHGLLQECLVTYVQTGVGKSSRDEVACETGSPTLSSEFSEAYVYSSGVSLQYVDNLLQQYLMTDSRTPPLGRLHSYHSNYDPAEVSDARVMLEAQQTQ